ncbi:IPT/TIG domain-containing protein [Alkaliflexus imshenetskii]|uniref:IPT/TIG domain-containing protein n=1 Tax=Alkaliflexus imshenetskii TaxID=286730 RepID=UPI00047E11F4|nr:IPT/TIG domain-containing protein [Alkaliflexus imshenetskii]
MKIRLIIISSVFLFFSCSYEVLESFDYPRVQTLFVTDASLTGAVLHGEIIAQGSSPVIESGFLVVREGMEFNFNRSEKALTNSVTQSGAFSATIDAALEKGVTYNLRAFARTKDYVSMGNLLSFVSEGSLPPVINSFYPHTALFGDTITIRGMRFSGIRNRVMFGTVEAQNIVTNSDSLIKVVVPILPNELHVPITVQTGDNPTTSAEFFSYLIPVIHQVSPQTGTYGDVITIKGGNLGYVGKIASVYFDDVIAQVIEISDRELKVKVPVVLTSETPVISIRSGFLMGLADLPFYLKEFILTDFNPKIIEDFSMPIEITLIGQYFNPVLKNNKVYISGVEIKVLSATTEEIRILLPNWIFPANSDLLYNYSKSWRISVKIAGSTRHFDDLLEIRHVVK